MAVIDNKDILSVTDASKRGVSGLVADAESGRDVIIARHSTPIACVIGVDRFGELQQAQEDLHDLALVMVRLLDDDGERYSLDDVMERYNLSQTDLDIAAGR